MIDVIKQNPRHAWFLAQVQRLQIEFPVAEIAKKTGYSEPTISQYLNSKSKVTLKFLELFCQAYKVQMPKDWSAELEKTSKVLERNARSVGSPVGTHTTKGGNEFTELSEGYFIMYPRRVSVKARAGYLMGWGDEEYIDSLPTHPFIVRNVHKGNYLSFDIDGDSMDDGSVRSIQDGNVALGRQINRTYWKSKLHFRDFPFFIIVHRTGILCKEIVAHDVEKGIIRCHSLNPNKKMYPDFDISLEDCIQIFNIVKVERDAKG